jgi:hypothetical protein
MIIKNHLTKLFILLMVGMAFLTQPVQAYVTGLGIGLPPVSTVALGATASSFGVTGQQKYNNDGIYPDYPSQKNVEVSPPDGATVMISSVPVVIQNQVGKNIFMANIPNDNGGYSTVILQKLGNRFIGLPGESL